MRKKCKLSRNNGRVLRVQYNVRYRWVLPIGHTAIDLMLLAFWFWYGQTMLRNQKHASHSSVFLQEQAVNFDIAVDAIPPKFVLLATGNWPAGAVAMSLRPRAYKSRSGHLWDPIWLLIHEAIAIPFWFLIGMWVDKGRPQLGKLMLIYLLARCVFGALDAAYGLPQVGILVQMFFWFWLTWSLISHGVRRILQMVRHTASL